MLTTLTTAQRDIGRDLAEADPDRVTAAQAADLVMMFAQVERLCSAGKVLFSNRAAQSTRWRDEGHRSAASWMAETTGTGVGDALNALETSCVLESLPETSDALRRGETSGSQLKIIAGAAAKLLSALKQEADFRFDAKALRRSSAKSFRSPSLSVPTAAVQRPEAR